MAGAGEMKVISGTLTWISNKSGHYIPEAQQLLQTLHSLGKKGVDLANVGLNLLAAGNGKKGVRYANVGAFLAAMQAIGEPITRADFLGDTANVSTASTFLYCIGKLRPAWMLLPATAR